MARSRFQRRSFLAMTAGSSIAGIGLANADSGASVTRTSFGVMEGTEQATRVYETTAAEDGPTVLVVGGIHGNETAGYESAHLISNWAIDNGTLVTIPEADVVAIEQSDRNGANGDLNRQFPTNGEPETALAQAIWDVVLQYDPDILIDLHESTGIYAGDASNGVGQAIFHSPVGDAAAAAHDAATYVNGNYVDESRLNFETSVFSGPNAGPSGLLAHKADREAGAEAYLIETLSSGVDLDTRVQWQTELVQQLASDLFDDVSGSVSTLNEQDQPNGELNRNEDEPVEEADSGQETGGETADETEPPTARITVLDDVDLDSLEQGQTVRLDASASTAAGDVEYSWDIWDDGSFDESGEQIEFTFWACSGFPIVLRVTDDQGRTDTDEIECSAA